MQGDKMTDKPIKKIVPPKSWPDPKPLKISIILEGKDLENFRKIQTAVEKNTPGLHSSNKGIVFHGLYLGAECYTDEVEK